MTEHVAEFADAELATARMEVMRVENCIVDEYARTGMKREKAKMVKDEGDREDAETSDEEVLYAYMQSIELLSQSDK